LRIKEQATRLTPLYEHDDDDDDDDDDDENLDILVCTSISSLGNEKGGYTCFHVNGAVVPKRIDKWVHYMDYCYI
jgi:hypothetical protein